MFSVISAGLITACRIILRHWKTPVVPRVQEWANAMTEIVSYECMLRRLANGLTEGDNASPWDNFWDHLKVDGSHD